MSEIVTLVIPIVGTAELLRTLTSLCLVHVKAKVMDREGDPPHPVDFVVSDDEGTRIGVRINEQTGQATFVAHDAADKRASALIGRIAQRHAYSRVMEELKRKGYQIAREETQTDGSIRLVAQRWR